MENAAECLLLVVVALAPLPFGSNGSESTWILTLACGLVLLSLAASLALDPARLPSLRAPRLTVGLVCFGLFALSILVQLVPGLPALLPHPLWAEGAAVLGTSSRATISLDPELTLQAIAKSSAYAAAGASAFLLAHDNARRRRILFAAALAGGLYAAYGLIEWASGDCCVAWQKKTAYLGDVTGPFINRNSFATYLGLIALLALGAILRQLGELQRIAAPSAVRRLLVRLDLLMRRQWPMILVLVAAVLALLFTHSRAGITSGILGAAVLVFVASHGGVLGEARRRWRTLAAFMVVILVLLGLFGGEVIGRVTQEGVEEADRTQSWSIIVTGIEASPWFGHGFGTFPESFPLYRDDRLASRRYWDKAQDTYLELAIDTGIPATAILLLGFCALALQCWHGLSRRRRERRIFPAIGLAALTLVAAHSVYDFSMQIPAIAAVFFVLMGVGLSESGVWRVKAESPA
jgi:O-antigen ligase